MALKNFPLIGIYQAEVKELKAGREKAKLIHGSGDTRAAGNQVEQPVRKAVTSRLPLRCRVTHGHIIDVSENVSPQIDIVVADGLRSGHLFQAEDGTEFVPFESVYAIGEVKTTYYKSERYIQAFSTSIASVKTMARASTGRNHLFSFMLFVDSNDFQNEDIEALYAQAKVDELPNVVCFLDRGIVVQAAFGHNGHGDLIANHYHVHPTVDTQLGRENHWCILNWGPDSDAQNLMFLQVILSQHIDTCELAPSNLGSYLLRYTGFWKEVAVLVP
jgi:hypothetical protein